jgi:hypothetical protein
MVVALRCGIGAECANLATCSGAASEPSAHVVGIVRE